MPFEFPWILLLKLGLVPLLLGAATLAQWKWGDAVGGWLAGFPFVAGPILLVLALQDGRDFAAHAAAGALVGVVLLSAFTLLHAWISRKLPWYAALAIGWVGYVLCASLVIDVHLDWPWAAASALVSLALSRWCLPAPTLLQTPKSARKGVGELVLRMVAAEVLVLTITGVSAILGPRFTGLLTPFPVATSVLLGFAHARSGSEAVSHTLRGFLPSLTSLVLFFVVIHLSLPSFSIAVSFVGAWSLAGVLQAMVFLFMKRNALA